jgi:hypothetical protein
VNSKWSHFNVVEDTEDSHIVCESFTSYLNELVGCIVWCTLREGSEEGVVVVLKFVVSEINTVEGKINVDFVTSSETGWGSALHGVLINIVSWHESNWSVEVIVLSHTCVLTFFWLIWIDLSESAHDSLESIGSVGEFLTLEPDFCTTGNVSVSWSDIIENWLLVVSEVVVGVDPVNGVEGNLNLDSIALLGSRRCALDSSG